MIRYRSRPIRVLVIAVSVWVLPTASFAQIKVITSGGFSAAYREALPEFERTARITVTTTSGASQVNGPTMIRAQLGRGVLARVATMSSAGLDRLMAEV